MVADGCAINDREAPTSQIKRYKEEYYPAWTLLMEHIAMPIEPKSWIPPLTNINTGIRYFASACEY